MNDEKGARLNQRIGKLTASRMYQALDMTKQGAEGAKRKLLKLELISERISGALTPHFVSEHMRWGIETEDEAKAAFEIATGRIISDCGFIEHPSIAHFGASPDGLLSDDAVIEFKCPANTTHISWLLAGGIPEQHKPQILVQLACTGREHAVFCSYAPRLLDPRLHLHIVEWTPKREEVEEIEEHARKFLAEVEAMFEQLTEKA